MSVIPPPLSSQRHLAKSRDTFGCYKGETGGVTRVSCVESRATAKCPTVYTKAPTTRGFLVHGINGAAVDKEILPSS